jgi:peptidoglycan/LPS O-acetylase OafA/YrhL
MTERFDVLDFYRFGGALCVAVVHFSIIYLPLSDSIKTQIDAGFQPLIGFFFTLSGFVITHMYDRRIHNRSDYLNYIRKRLARIYPLHLVTLVAALLLGTITSFTTTDNTLVPTILLVHAWNTTAHLSLNYPSWSVSAEFFVYLLFPIFLMAIKRCGLWISLTLPILGIVTVSSIFKLYGLGEWTHANYNFGCLRAVPSFVGGIVVYRLAVVRFANLVVPSWIAHGLAISTVPMMFLDFPNVLMLVVFMLVVFMLARGEPATATIFSAPWCRNLANSSYSFYMLHSFAGFVLLGYLPKLSGIDLSGFWKVGMTIGALAITTGVSILSFRYFEDPVRRLLGTAPIWKSEGCPRVRSNLLTSLIKRCAVIQETTIQASTLHRE